MKLTDRGWRVVGVLWMLGTVALTVFVCRVIPWDAVWVRVK